MYKRGLTGVSNCKETVRLFKIVAEKGPWMDQLSVAHKRYAEGNELAALNLFAQLAAVGVESAQYNAAYILSKCTRCAPVDKTASLLLLGGAGVVGVGVGGSTSMSATVENPFVADPLERQHRSNKHSTVTDFRQLLKDHEIRERQAASTPHMSSMELAPVSKQGQNAVVVARSVAYLPTEDWKEFLSIYQPNSLVDAIDLEFQTGIIQS